MKTRVVSTKYLLEIWEGAISMTLFPEEFFDKLRPLEILNSWGDELPTIRENLRPRVDSFIEQVLDCEDPEDHWRALQEIDSEIMALYYDRLNSATLRLRGFADEKDVVEISTSWTTVVALLLFEMCLQ